MLALRIVVSIMWGICLIASIYDTAKKRVVVGKDMSVFFFLWVLMMCTEYLLWN